MSNVTTLVQKIITQGMFTYPDLSLTRKLDDGVVVGLYLLLAYRPHPKYTP